MLDKPLNISRYLLLAVKEPLDKSQMRSWLQIARRTAPSGVIASVQTTDDQGTLRSVSMVHREGKKKHSYLIPLTRDLGAEEVHKIVEAFAEEEPDLDFDVETNSVEIAPEERNGISVNDEQHLAVCTAMAKARHNKWMRDRLNSGWRYGLKVDSEEMTHPMLRPWEQLPDNFRQIDMDSPQALLDLIAAQGYAIIAQDELDRLQRKARS